MAWDWTITLPHLLSIIVKPFGGAGCAYERVNPPTHPLFRVVRRTRVRDGVGVWQRASYG